jgi:hypothetical protein
MACCWPREIAGAGIVRSETMAELGSFLSVISGSFAAPAADSRVTVESRLAA